MSNNGNIELTTFKKRNKKPSVFNGNSINLLIEKYTEEVNQLKVKKPENMVKEIENNTNLINDFLLRIKNEIINLKLNNSIDYNIKSLKEEFNKFLVIINESDEYIKILTEL